MGSFELKILMDNAAFEDGNHMQELARILSDLADKVGADTLGDHYFKDIRDINGNVVGTYRLTLVGADA